MIKNDNLAYLRLRATDEQGSMHYINKLNDY